jgi:hypothetical protein
MVAHSETGGLDIIPYFTEDPQTQEFHKLAFQIFCLVITYGGYLGQLIRTSNTEPQVQETVLESAERVFKYAEKEKDIPTMGRQDLVQFRQSLKQQGNFQGDISLN